LIAKCAPTDAAGWRELRPNPQMRAALADNERAWTRLAIETEMIDRTKHRGRAPKAINRRSLPLVEAG